MPHPNPLNPVHCGRFMRKNGRQKSSGRQVYRCKCGFTFTEGDYPVGRQPIGDEPMMGAERQRKHYRKCKKKKRIT